MAIDLDEVDTPSKADSANNVAASAAAGPKVDKMGNTIVADEADEALVALSSVGLCLADWQ